MNNRLGLVLGWLNPLLFWSTTWICGLLLGEYDHLSNLVSELGALGTPTQHLFTAGLLLSSGLNLFLVMALLRVGKEYGISPWPALSMLLFSFLAGPALFPMPLPAHGLSGLPFPFFMVSPLLAMVLWRRSPVWSRLRYAAFAGMTFFALGFLIFFPDILPAYFGLKQRFLYLGWTIWSVGLTWSMVCLLRSGELAADRTG